MTRSTINDAEPCGHLTLWGRPPRCDLIGDGGAETIMSRFGFIQAALPTRPEFEELLCFIS